MFLLKEDVYYTIFITQTLEKWIFSIKNNFSLGEAGGCRVLPETVSRPAPLPPGPGGIK